MSVLLELIENEVNVKRFNMNSLSSKINIKITEDEYQILSSNLNDLKELLNEPRTFEYIHQCIIRNSFLIELVNKEVSSTKFEVRWTDKLSNDPRFASFDDCMYIYSKLINNILEFNKEYIDLLADFTTNSIVSYELPVDYIDNNTSNKQIHHHENIYWIETTFVEEILLLRKLLLDKNFNDEHDLFSKVMKNKIKVKTYLTDRVLTGDYKTNREKRWETHPSSVHFAFRKECWKIEQTLLLQICRFENVPTKLTNYLVESSLLDKDFSKFTCPITGDTIDFLDFKFTILNGLHGKSKYQVGHMNPLKSVTNRDFGHTARNISWITEDGNRLQGNLSLEEVDELILRIIKNKYS